MREDAVAEARVRALIFDLDGTLYNQKEIRIAMGGRLIAEALRSPARGYRTARVLRAYRRAQETLRRDQTTGPPTARQMQLACAEAGVSADEGGRCIQRWMHEEPLALLRGRTHTGLVGLLRRSRAAGLRLAVLSDYPASRKLEVMGLIQYFDAVVCADDPDVLRLKPDPRGLRVTLDRLGVEAHEAIYVGDRADVDGLAASRAGVRFVLFGSSRPACPDRAWLSIRSYDELSEVVLDASAD
jgi:FMN phosphatase YigB (HAD superfamily)